MPSKFDELRSKAEELLTKRGPSEFHEMDVLRIIHELEVHQIELQMQNEELLRTKHELEESQKAYADLYDLAPVGYVTANEKGIITQVNFTVSLMLLTPKSALNGSHFYPYIMQDDRKAVFDLLQTAAAGNHKGFVGEIRLLRSLADTFWARMEIAPSWNKNGSFDFWRIVFQDVSKLKQAEEELRKAYEELELRVQERTAELKSANEELRLTPSRLIQAQENERQRLAVELRDSIGQTLAALKFRTELVISALEKRESKEALRLLNEYIPILQRSIDETITI